MREGAGAAESERSLSCGFPFCVCVCGCKFVGDGVPSRRLPLLVDELLVISLCEPNVGPLELTCWVSSLAALVTCVRVFVCVCVCLQSLWAVY